MQPAWRRIFQIVGGTTWQAHTGLFERRITVQVVQNGLWSRDTLQVLGRGDADLQDALHKGGLGGDGGWWGVPRSRVGMQSQNISVIGLTEPPEPLAHERRRDMESASARSWWVHSECCWASQRNAARLAIKSASESMRSLLSSEGRIMWNLLSFYRL